MVSNTKRLPTLEMDTDISSVGSFGERVDVVVVIQYKSFVFVMIIQAVTEL